jgi:hypothetical protein
MVPMTDRPELTIVANDAERGYMFEQRFSPPEFHGLTQTETPDGVVYTAAIGGLLRAHDVAEILTYPINQPPGRLGDIARGLRMLTYPKGTVAKLLRRSKHTPLQAVDHVGMRDDLHGIRSVLFQAPEVIEADLQLFGSSGKAVVARDYLSSLPSTEIIGRVTDLPDTVFDQVSAAFLKRGIHNFRVGPERRRVLINEYLGRIGIQTTDKLIESVNEELFYDMWQAFGFAGDMADTWVLQQELPARIQRMITQGPEFRAETVPAPPKQPKSVKNEYVARTHVRFHPKTNQTDRLLQPKIAWSETEGGEKKLLFPPVSRPNMGAEATVQQSYIAGAAVLAGLAVEGPDYARQLRRLLAAQGGYAHRHMPKNPRWAAGLLPLFLPLGGQSIVRQIPSEGYFRRQKSQTEMNDVLWKLGEGGLFGGRETP